MEPGTDQPPHDPVVSTAPDTPAPLRFARVLRDAAAAPGLRKTERTRLRLLESIARQLTDGTELADLRVTDIAAAAGLAHGTFYRYFPDLRSAVDALIGEFSAFLHARLADARDGSPGSRARVRGATLVYTRLFRANAGLMRCLITLARDGTAFRRSFQTLNQAWNLRMAAAIARGRRGPESTSDLVPTAYALGGMVDEFLTQLYLRQDPALAPLADDEDAVAELLTDLWCRAAYGRLEPESI